MSSVCAGRAVLLSYRAIAELLPLDDGGDSLDGF
jgi:hypothetical protein